MGMVFRVGTGRRPQGSPSRAHPTPTMAGIMERRVGTDLLEDVFCLLKEVAEYVLVVLFGLFALETGKLFK